MSALVGGHHVRANGIRQHYLRYGGRGAPMVVVPGITSPAITWGFVAERLAHAYDVFVLDVRGRGLSESGPHLGYGLDALADDLAAFVAALGLEQTFVLGHSMGARIAIRACARTAPAVARLILADPPVSGPGRRAYPSALPWYVDSIRLAAQGMSAEAMRTFCPTWSNEQLALRAEWLHTCFEPAVVAAFEGFHTDNIHRDLPSLSMPTRLLVPERGGVILPADLAEIRTLNPAIEVAHVPDAGHMIPWDNLEGFLNVVGHPDVR